MAGSYRAVITEIVRLRVRWRPDEPKGEAAKSYTTLSVDGSIVSELAAFGINAKDRAEAILCALNMTSPTQGPKNTSLSRYVQACLTRELGNLARHYRSLTDQLEKTAAKLEDRAALLIHEQGRAEDAGAQIRIKRNGTVETGAGRHLGSVFNNEGRWYAYRPNHQQAGEGRTRKEAVTGLLKVCKRQKLIKDIPAEYLGP